MKAGTNRGAGVDDDPHAQGQIDLLVEGVHLGRRLLVVEQGKVALLQIGIVMPMPVGDGEDEVDLIDAQFDCGRARIRRLIGCLGRRLLGRRRWRRLG